MTKKKVLVIDDDKEMVEQVVKGLVRSNYEASGLSDPRRAGVEAKKSPFDLILVDIRMPSYSGLQVVTDIAAYAPQSKVLVMSASKEVDEILECIRHGAVDFVPKPFEIKDLVQRIEFNLGRPRFEQSPAILRETLIDSLWANVEHETPGKRGVRLEQLLKHIFASIPFFDGIVTNLRTELEEIDIEFVNRGEDNFWKECGGIMLAECKNWSERRGAAGIQEFDHFWGTLLRSAFAKVGFFISYSGFSPEFSQARGRALGHGRIVVPIDRENLRELVLSHDRTATLETHVREAGH